MFRFRSWVLIVVISLLIVFIISPASAYSSWENAYYDFVVSKSYRSSGQNYPAAIDPAFALHDMDGDGIPELLIFNGADNHAEGTTYAYTFRNDTVQYIGNIGVDIWSDGLYYYPDSIYPGLVSVGGSGGYMISEYATIRGGEFVRESIAEYGTDFISGKDVEFNKCMTSDGVLYRMTQSEEGRKSVIFTDESELNGEAFIASWEPTYRSPEARAADARAIYEAGIPDPAFLSCLNELTDDSGNKIIETMPESIKQMDVSGRGLSSLKGLDLFKNLEALKCQDNQLTELDIGSNPALTALVCSYNQLTGLDLSHNTKLGSLDCTGNRLTELNVSGLSELSSLKCSDNKLTGLDISRNEALRTLDCSGNQLYELDVSGQPGLIYLYCSWNQYISRLDISGNVKLSTLECSDNQIMELDLTRNPKLYHIDCGYNQLTALDISQNVELKMLSCQGNQLTALDVSQNVRLETLDCYNNQLISLELQNSPDLKRVDCGYNQLASININNLQHLTKLDVRENHLTELNVSGNTALTELSCDNNQLTELDVRSNTELTFLSCSGNQLTELDISNNPDLAQLFCTNNHLTELDISHCPALIELVRTVKPIEWSDNCISYYTEDNSCALWIDNSVWLNTGDEVFLPKLSLSTCEHQFEKEIDYSSIVFKPCKTNEDCHYVARYRWFNRCTICGYQEEPISVTCTEADGFMVSAHQYPTREKKCSLCGKPHACVWVYDNAEYHYSKHPDVCIKHTVEIVHGNGYCEICFAITGPGKVIDEEYHTLNADYVCTQCGKKLDSGYADLISMIVDPQPKGGNWRQDKVMYFSFTDYVYYGAYQGRPVKEAYLEELETPRQIDQNQENMMRSIIRKNLGDNYNPVYDTRAGILNHLWEIGNYGCGYAMLSNALAQYYIATGKTDQFEQQFGYPFFDENGLISARYRYMLVDMVSFLNINKAIHIDYFTSDSGEWIRRYFESHGIQCSIDVTAYKNTSSEKFMNAIPDILKEIENNDGKGILGLSLPKGTKTKYLQKDGTWADMILGEDHYVTITGISEEDGVVLTSAWGIPFLVDMNPVLNPPMNLSHFIHYGFTNPNRNKIYLIRIMFD